MTTFEIISAIVLVFTLGLSIYNFYITRRDKKPLLTSKLSYGFIGHNSQKSEQMLIIEVANAGEKLVNIVSVYIPLRDFWYACPFIEGTKRFPFDLPPGHNATFWLPKNEFVLSLKKHGYSGIIKIKAFFQDAIGNKYYSKPLKISIEK